MLSLSHWGMFEMPPGPWNYMDYDGVDFKFRFVYTDNGSIDVESGPA